MRGLRRRSKGPSLPLPRLQEASLFVVQRARTSLQEKWMNKIFLSISLMAIFTASASAQRCDSIVAVSHGGWQPISLAPRDGTTIEMLETYGVAPWYGLFKWTRYRVALDLDGKFHVFTAIEPSWIGADNPTRGVQEDSCLFWRPYKGTGKYVDPTGGAQNSMAYWCAAIYRRYNKKKDACEK